MRKYRAKRVDNNEWVEGWYCTWQGIEYIFDSPWNLYHKGRYEIRPETIAQDTGKLDKNDKPIFGGKGGDIVEYDVTVPIWDDDKEIVIEHRPETRRDLITYEAPKFVFRWYPEKCIIIGNAIDNPELLEDK